MSSRTIIIPTMFKGDPSNERAVQDFFIDAYPEFRKFGPIIEVHICENHAGIDT